jgi:hypothetical protein
MPLALREFYEFAGTGKRAFVINDLLAPDEIWTDAGRVFYVEKQGVWVWGIAEGDWLADDPSVWCRENEPGSSWLQDAPSVSVFLVQMLVMSVARLPARTLQTRPGCRRPMRKWCWAASAG